MTAYGTHKLLEQAGTARSAAATALTVLASALASYHGIAALREMSLRRPAAGTAAAIFLALLAIGM